MPRKLLIFLLLCAGILRAQPGKEAWHWRFGSKCGMEFSSGAPAQETGLPSTWQSPFGSACVSNENTGQYLFSTNGIKVFNKNNLVMYNGYNMTGHLYAPQNLIVPKPDSANLFYVFNPDWSTLPNQGIHYSVVDMLQQGGLGAVTLKNQVLTPGPTTDKLTAVRHCNGKDYWVLSHPANSNTFNAYLLTKNGINLTPVVSSAGTIHQYITPYNSNAFREGFGSLKASPNGKKLALGIESDALPILEIFDFDNSTGMVSNAITVNYPGQMGPWSVSFSPDNSKLYSVPHTLNFDTTYVYQYDLSSGIPAQIIASQTLVFQMAHSMNGYMNFLSTVQIGPDGKIYVSRYLTDTLAVINDPNSTGLACNFQYPGPILPGTFIMMGLPNFIDANYAGIQINVPDAYQCSSFTVATIDAGPGYSNYQWNTGATTQTISVNNPGQYWVTVTNDQGCQRTDTVGAYVVQPLNIDTAVCDSFNADLTQAGAIQYNWYDSTSNPVKNISQSGSYYVDVTFQSGCVLRDSVSVSVISSPKVELGPPVSLCDFQIGLDASYPGVTFNWSTGATTPSVTVNQPGVYWVTLQNSSGCTGTDTLVIGPPWQLIELLIPNIVTPNDDKINDEIDFAKFQFSAFNITIYNRWGQQVFASESADAIWKPTGVDGTYFYTAQYRIDCGIDTQARSIKGFITVLR